MAIVYERDTARNSYVTSTETGFKVKLGPLASAQQVRDARKLVAEHDRHASKQQQKENK